MEPKYYAVKNWGKFQHYKDHGETGRITNWVKLYTRLHDDPGFYELSDLGKLLLPHIYILAAKTGNRIPNDGKWVQNRIGITVKISLMEYVTNGFLIPHVGKDSIKSIDKFPTIEEKRIEVEENRKEKNLCTDSAEASSLPTENASHGSTRSLIAFNYESGSLTGVDENDISEWERAYPAVDVRRNIAAAAVWLGANPQKRKKNIRRFLVNWLSRAQEKGGDPPKTIQPRLKSPISTGLAAIAATRQRRPDD